MFADDWGDAAGIAAIQDNSGGFAPQLAAIQQASHNSAAAATRAMTGSTVGRAIVGGSLVVLIAGGLLWLGGGESSTRFGGIGRFAAEAFGVGLGTIVLLALWAAAFGYGWNVPGLSDLWRVAVGRESQLGVPK